MHNSTNSIMGMVLYIDLSQRTYQIEELPEHVLKKYVGGKGIATWLLYKELNKFGRQLDPYEEANPVIFAGGPLTGTDAPAMRGVAVSTSPLTGGYVDSFYGGHLSQEIRYAGFEAVVITGKSPEPLTVSIENDAVKFLEAEPYWGMDALEVNHKLKEDLNDDTLKIASIGPAGENLIPYALVSCEYNRHAGRGGIGAVMGSKLLKAITLRGTDTIKVYDEYRFSSTVQKAKQELKESDESQELTASGTAAALWFAHDEGLLPVKNYQKGTFNPDGLAQRAQREKIWLRDVGCSSCPIRCSKVGVIKEGKRSGTVTDIVEYETAALMGINLGIDDINEVAYLVRLCDELGMDGMSAGSVVGFAMDCFADGILTSDEYDGIELVFGSKDNIAEVLQMTANRTGKLGRLLAKGTKRAAAELGTDAVDKASHVKGMDIPAWDPRGAPGMGLAYLTADRGACHQRAFPIEYEVNGSPFNNKTFERLQLTGKAETVYHDQNFSAGLDTFVKCDFGTVGISEERYLELFEAATGESMDGDRLRTIGERIWNLSRLINLQQGISYQDERLPKRFYEALPDGPVKGHKFTREDELIMLSEYYSLRGWNEYGEPTQDKLSELEIYC